MNERTAVDVRSTLEALSPLARDLRTRGYDASLWAEHRGDHFTVEIRIRIPPLGVPIEALTLAAGDSGGSNDGRPALASGAPGRYRP